MTLESQIQVQFKTLIFSENINKHWLILVVIDTNQKKMKVPRLELEKNEWIFSHTFKGMKFS